MIIYKECIIGHLFKCAGTSVGEKLRREDIKNIAYFSGHDSINVLKSSNFDFCKDYKQFALVRNPLTFYESFYNYVREFPGNKSFNHDNITKFLMFDEYKNPYSLSEYIERCMDLGKTLNEKHLESIKEKFKESQGYYSTWVADWREFKFPNISFYQWAVENILLSDCTTFKMESEIDIFLEAIGSGGELGNKNVTGERTKGEYVKSTASETDKKLILETDKCLFKRFNYDIK